MTATFAKSRSKALASCATTSDAAPDWMSRLSNALNIDELAALARRRLPRGLYEYLDRGAEDEVTMRGNADSIKRVYLRQRVAVNVSKRDPSTSVLGIPQTLTIGIAATGLASLI